MLRAIGLTVLLVLVTWTLSAAPAGAGCAVGVHSTVAVTPYAATTVVTPFYPTVAVQAYPVVVPSYSASYLGGSYSEMEARLRLAVRDELRNELGVEKRLRALEGGAVATAKAAPMARVQENVPAPSGGMSLQTACARCHSEETANAAKTTFAFFKAGQQRPLSPEETGDVLERITTDNPSLSMPRGQNLSGAERVALVREVLRFQNAAAAQQTPKK